MITRSLFLLSFIYLLQVSCKEKKLLPVNNVQQPGQFIPVTQFIEGDLSKIDSLPVTPLRTLTHLGKTDSEWIKKDDVKKYAQEFLHPQIDSLSMHQYFKENSFLDQSINSFTFSYEPQTTLPSGLNIKHWDVYVNPTTQTIDRLYIVKQNDSAGASVTKQLTWKTGNSFTVTTLKESKNGPSSIIEEKVIWNFTQSY